jgi:hypothetical protein
MSERAIEEKVVVLVVWKRGWGEKVEPLHGRCE